VLGYGLQGDLLNSDSSEIDIIALMLLSRSRGDEIMEYCLETNVNLAGIFTPTTRKQAMLSPQREFWLEAEQKEIESIKKKKVLQAAQLPSGKKLLKTKWVYRIKYGATGEFKSY